MKVFNAGMIIAYHIKCTFFSFCFGVVGVIII